MQNELSKTFIIFGIIALMIGIGLRLSDKLPGLGKLPGDIVITKENFQLYFPLTTCIIISLILSILFFLWNQK